VSSKPEQGWNLGVGGAALAVALLAAGLLGGAARPAFAASGSTDNDKTGIVCWTDEQGERNCGDHVPPQYAKNAHEIYNKQGVEVKTTPREETPEEQAEREQRQQQAEQEQATAREQAAHDAYLLEGYRDVSDLEAERDGRLQFLDTRIQLAEKAVADSEAALAGLHARIDAARDKNEDPDPRLLQQVATFEASHTDNVNALERARQQREATAARFERDIKRYQVLRP
jgi:hypothetical protein